MEAQVIFDTVVDHLFAQGKPAVHKEVCAYRGARNTKCAVGILIPDEVYSSRMEGEALNLEFLRLFPQLPVWFKEHFNLLLDLQCVHDGSYKTKEGTRFERVFVPFTNDYLNRKLSEVARQKDLTYTPRKKVRKTKASLSSSLPA